MKFWDSCAIIPLCLEEPFSGFLRALVQKADSLQLAAALIWSGNHPEGFEFVCLDTRLRDAAQAEGFSVLPAQNEYNPQQFSG